MTGEQKKMKNRRACRLWKKGISLLLASALIMSGVKSTARCAEPDDLKNASGNENLALSVDPTGRKEGFSAVIFDNSNGLPTSEANAIAETSDGFIWIGSYAGLIRYDGNTFERMDSTGGISSIKCLFVDSRDRLWIGTNDNGVAVMERGEFRMWGKLDGMRSAHTRAITEGTDGTIYIATTNGIMMIDQDYQLSSVEYDGADELNMRDLRVGIDGAIYGASDNGDLLMIRDGAIVKCIRYKESPLQGVGTIMPDPEKPGCVYQEAPDYCLYRVDLTNGFEILEKIEIEPLKYLKSMEYIDGKIWLCAGNGIGVLENGKCRVLENLPMNNNVGHVMTDYLGNLWFTSTRQGVMKVVPNQFSDLFERFGIPQTVVNSTCMCDGQLFVATDAGLIVLDKNGPVSRVPLTKAVSASGVDLGANDLIELLDGTRIRSIVRDSRDRIWISTWRSIGLLCYDKGVVTAFTEEDGLLSGAYGSFRTVSEGKDGRILVAETGGVDVIQDDKVVASYGEEIGIVNTESLTVEEGFDSEIILGSNGGGIYIIKDGNLRTINVEEGLPSDIVMRLKRDEKRNVIWIVTSSAIAYMTPDYQVTTVKKFPYTNNFDLYENSKEDMWVLSSNGIYVVPAQEMIDNGEINPVFYGTDSGLPCITTANSYSELTPEGDLYIAGSTGVAKVNIEKPFEDVNDLRVIVPFVEADGQTVYPDENGDFTIASTVQKLTVPSFVLNYSLSNPQVSYQLEGFEKKNTTVSRSDLVPVDYTNLRGGAYNFVLNIKDAMGRGNKTVSVRIIKEKAFYEQTWFFIIVILLALLLLFAGMRFYIRRRLRAIEKKQREAREMFEQTSEALAGAIDAKDSYTNGHSRRVAEYSLKIAQQAGKSEEECEKVYFAALLHDVGKIGVPIEIITKKGRLTDEEFEQIKQHPVVGGQILSSIRNSPWLSLGARYHHERYNGKGYPEGIKGEEIPEIARIIAVADAYDAMTSNRSYRNAIPQHIVREELVKGIGTQFDPNFVNIMIHMVDLDTEYKMKESESGAALSPMTSLRCDSIYHECTEGIAVTTKKVKISLCCQPYEGFEGEECLPSLILFDSLDGRVHPGEEDNKNILYCEYAQIRLDGFVTERNTRKSEVVTSDQEGAARNRSFDDPEREEVYEIEAVHYKDHVLVQISGEKHTTQIILALPDSSRFAYISIGGEHCYVHNIRVENEDAEAGPDTIRRIAEEISYIRNCPRGDIPNIQVDGWRSDTTNGIPVKDSLTLRFHSMSLPTARLLWHCPFISVFSSADGSADGSEFREYLLLRLDGETWDSDEHAENRVQVERLDSFVGWDSWKEKNKQGLDCVVNFRREKNTITIETENLGVSIRSFTTIHDDVKDVYVALTGDQCAITDIHIES
ncbi:MAG: HD domain-containing protein [Lachnospiraceae bacterium]|nr:HD domain-containing protein [Lachnospiraceae bacterium]